MSRKDMAKEFLRLCPTGKVRDAYERFAAAEFPQTRIETKYIFEEGDPRCIRASSMRLPNPTSRWSTSSASAPAAALALKAKGMEAAPQR